MSRGGSAGGGCLAGGAAATAMALRPVAPVAAQEQRSFTRAVDLTLTTSPELPTFSGQPQLEFEVMARFAEQKYNMYRWKLVEHTGTHIDIPLHFSPDGPSVDRIPVERLVCPLCVVDIAARAEDDPDAQLTPDDLEAWEAANGPFPPGACIAMHSGWEQHVTSARYRNADGEGKMHFPGFHVEAVQKLLEGGAAGGIAVDTLSLDFGASQDFATHYAWLPARPLGPRMRRRPRRAAGQGRHDRWSAPPRSPARRAGPRGSSRWCDAQASPAAVASLGGGH